MWWDDWGGNGAVARRYDIEGKSQSKVKVMDGWVNGEWRFNDLRVEVLQDLQRVNIREGEVDQAIYKWNKDGRFTLASAKKMIA